MIDPAVDAGFGETRGQVTARLGERSFGATRSFTAGGAGGCRHRGNSETQRRQHRKVRNSRTLEDPSVGAAKGLRIRGNLETHRRRSREMQDSGRPRRLIAGVTGEREIRGNSKIRSKGARKGAGFEETRRPVSGEAGGAKFRGNPEFHRQASRRRWIRGNWKTHRQVERDEAWSSVTCEFTVIETPGAPASGVFVCARLTLAPIPNGLHHLREKAACTVLIGASPSDSRAGLPPY